MPQGRLMHNTMISIMMYLMVLCFVLHFQLYICHCQCAAVVAWLAQTQCECKLHSKHKLTSKSGHMHEERTHLICPIFCLPMIEIQSWLFYCLSLTCLLWCWHPHQKMVQSQHHPLPEVLGHLFRIRSARTFSQHDSGTWCQIDGCIAHATALHALSASNAWQTWQWHGCTHPQLLHG